MLQRGYPEQVCSIARALEVIGERWTLLIIRDAFYGVQRFNDFQAHLDIPKSVLSQRLSALVREGILERRPDPQHAGRTLYELTAAGRDLWPAVNALLSWGARHRRPNSLVFRHSPCGTKLDARGNCPACQLTPLPEDILTEPAPGAARRRTDPVALALRQPRRLLDPIHT
jgi:DNA-binding HxlR family transcriptional regulator